MSDKKSFLTNLFNGRKVGDCNEETVPEIKEKGGCCDMQIAEETTGCDCGGVCYGESEEEKSDGVETEQADILILGPGCKNCQKLEQNVKEALERFGKNIKIAHVTDFGEIASYGVMSTPGLVIRGKMVSCGRVLKVDDIIKFLEDFSSTD